MGQYTVEPAAVVAVARVSVVLTLVQQAVGQVYTLAAAAVRLELLIQVVPLVRLVILPTVALVAAVVVLVVQQQAV